LVTPPVLEGSQLERPQPLGGEDERAWRRRAAADHVLAGKGLRVSGERVVGCPAGAWL